MIERFQNLGTDGEAISLLSGIRSRILEDDALSELFLAGDSISPSQDDQYTELPRILLSHVSNSQQRLGTGAIIDLNDRVRVSLYSVSYDGCYNIGRRLNNWLLTAKDSIVHEPGTGENYSCTLQPAMTSGPRKEPGVNGVTGEVWKWDLDYFAVTGNRNTTFAE